MILFLYLQLCSGSERTIFDFIKTGGKSDYYINYTLWISRCIAAARERIPGSIENYVTGVSECSQQRSNLKDDGYITRMQIIYLINLIY
ncbi:MULTISPECIES: hypothetical protein [Photorhabdus]|uniref:hypothetical protein n=1 Tax=Photorhabdus TaxID=29487 RepID=UPI0013140FE6|nr:MULTISPECIES: hypothetical protein [Photorhabdus]NDK96046.1 hypothetical protein [Photorhabdus laumondii subsp. laumondii]NDL49851.1 hypothetical protein [Photorhabdus laumondii subsp. laumondii]